MTNEQISVPTPEKKLADTTRRDYIFFAACLLLCLLVGNMLYGGGMQGGFALCGILLLSTAILYLGKPKNSVLSVASLAASYAILISFALYENTAFAFFKFNFLLLALSVFFTCAYGIKAPSMDDFRALLSPFYLFFGETVRAVPLATRSLGRKNATLGKNIGKVLLALILALPLLAVLTALLISADKAFESFVSNLDLDASELITTLTLGVLFFFVSFPLLFAIRKRELRMQSSTHKPYLSCLDNIIVSTVLLSVALLYLVFLVTQLSYLVGGFAGLLPEDYTYADYARRGFFEMFLICLVNLGTIFVAEVFVKRKENGKVPPFTQALNLFICLFSLFLIGSAFAKMFLYIRTYGLTFLRLGTSIFMLLLFFVFVFRIVKSFAPKFPAMRTVLILACLLMTVFSLVEPYKIIVDYNMYRYEQTDRLDIYYITYDCGSYGIEVLPALAAVPDEGIATIAKERLDNLRRHATYKVGGIDLRGESLSHAKTCKALAKYYAE